MTSIKELQDLLKDPREFGIVPFWFLNHYPEKEVIRRQIRDMAGKGVAGVMVHARNGLIGGYLDRHWEETVSCIAEEAQKHRLKLWLYDELNFPSGSAGGKVLEKYPRHVMQSLELAYEGKTPPKERYDKLIRFKDLYLGFSIRSQVQYPDYLNETVASEFVRLSYRWYAERFGKLFGSVIPGEFTDNACGNFGFFRRAIPWTEKMEEKFFASSGTTLDEILPSLFFDTEKSPLHRLLFWRFFGDLFLHNFVMRIEKECERNGISATGHYCIEHGLSEHVRQIGDRFALKRHQQLPGVDMLGRGTYRVLGDFPFRTPSIMLALTASPAYFFHGSRVLCECFGLSLNWRMNLAELRRMTGTLAALGVDLFVPHGFYYSIGGHRKRECIPDFYHNTMWDQLGQWSLFAARLSALTAHSLHIADTALFYPVMSQQAGVELLKTPSVTNHGTRCDRIDAAMMKTGNLLVRNAVPFEAVDEEVLDRARLEGGELLIPLPGGGIHRLRTVILPSVWIMGEKAFKKLREFSGTGGRIIGLGERLSLIFDGTDVVPARYPADFYTAFFADFPEGTAEDKAFEKAVKAGVKHSRIRVGSRRKKLILREWVRKDGRYFALLHNMSREKLSKVAITCDFSPAVLDLDTLSCSRMPARSFRRDFDYGEILLLTESEEGLPVGCEPPAPSSFWIPGIEKWRITLKNHNALRLNDMNCTYGRIERSFRSEFRIGCIPSALSMALDIDPTAAEAAAGVHPFVENGVVSPRNRCRLKINGKTVPDIRFGTSFDRWICEADIRPFVHVGKNTAELIQHCANVETNGTVPEPFMLFGPFGVRGDAVVPAPEVLRSSRWDETDLKHYSGLIEYTNTIPIPRRYRGKIFGLQLENVYETAELLIDGIFCGSRIMPPWRFSIDPALTTGDALTLTLRIRNTPANRWEEPIPSGFDGPPVFLIR